MTRDDAMSLCFKEAIKIWNSGSSDGLCILIDKIYDDFEKELDKVKREFYIKGSNDCHDAMVRAGQRSKYD